MVKILTGDCREVLRTMADGSVDSCVTDPPYGLSFMGKSWDYDIPGVDVWREVLRVLKPGGYLLSFAGTRTQHRMACRIEDAGFEIRDMIAWVYGSGFPKSLDVSKAIDKAKGVEREVVGKRTDGRYAYGFTDEAKRAMGDIVHADSQGFTGEMGIITAPATDAARQWSGWGTALKPAMEPITVARKPLIGTVAENVLKYSTGALNIDGCRVEGDSGSGVWGSSNETCQDGRTFNASPKGKDYRSRPLRVKHPNPASDEKRNAYSAGLAGSRAAGTTTVGRWPANLIHDGSNEVLGLFPQSAGQQGDVLGTEPSHTGEANCYGDYGRVPASKRGDSGSASRFFYCAKASKSERDAGCDGIPQKASSSMSGRRDCSEVEWKSDNNVTARFVTQRRNHHPTVKPLALMSYLVRLVTPLGGTILDPFLGSGSTAVAAASQGFNCIGLEIDPEYAELARNRSGLFCNGNG